MKRGVFLHGTAVRTHTAIHSIPSSSPIYVCMYKYIDKKGCNVVHQEVCSGHSRDESEEHIAHRWWNKQGIHPDFEIVEICYYQGHLYLILQSSYVVWITLLCDRQNANQKHVKYPLKISHFLGKVKCNINN